MRRDLARDVRRDTLRFVRRRSFEPTPLSAAVHADSFCCC